MKSRICSVNFPSYNYIYNAIASFFALFENFLIQNDSDALPIHLRGQLILSLCGNLGNGGTNANPHAQYVSKVANQKDLQMGGDKA